MSSQKSNKSERKIPLPEKTYKAPSERAKAEGKTPDELAAKIVEEKAKRDNENSFQAETRINDYGFLHIKEKWFAELGWTKGMAITIEKNADGSVTIRKP